MPWFVGNLLFGLFYVLCCMCWPDDNLKAWNMLRYSTLKNLVVLTTYYSIIFDKQTGDVYPLTLILLTWRIWWAPNNASRWRMEFNSAFKGLKLLLCSHPLWRRTPSQITEKFCLHILNSVSCFICLLFLHLSNSTATFLTNGWDFCDSSGTENKVVCRWLADSGRHYVHLICCVIINFLVKIKRQHRGKMKKLHFASARA
jgi:hypothetical protein